MAQIDVLIPTRNRRTGLAIELMDLLGQTFMTRRRSTGARAADRRNNGKLNHLRKGTHGIERKAQR